MAEIRSREWESQEYWRERLRADLAGESSPREALKPRTSYVACEAGAVVGFIAGHLTRRHSCREELEWINVIPERRGSGIARELLRLLAAWFAARKALRICADVQPGNHAARRFYRRHAPGS